MRIETARDVESPSQDERVHDVRPESSDRARRIELCGAQVGKSAEKTDKTVRNWGGGWRGRATYAVQAHTFRILGTRLSRDLPAGLLERLRDVGEQLRRDTDAKSVEKELRRTARALQRVRRRLGGGASDHGRRAIGKGITRTYSRRGARWRRCTRDPTPEQFHEWRKLVKLLSNELKIVGPAVPELATRYAVKVEKLGDILGQIHDLDIAAATTDRHPRWFGSDADLEVVRGTGRRAPGRAGARGLRAGRGRVRGAAARRARAGRDGLEDVAQARPQVEEVATEQAA